MIEQAAPPCLSANWLPDRIRTDLSIRIAADSALLAKLRVSLVEHSASNDAGLPSRLGRRRWLDIQRFHRLGRVDFPWRGSELSRGRPPLASRLFSNAIYNCSSSSLVALELDSQSWRQETTVTLVRALVPPFVLKCSRGFCGAGRYCQSAVSSLHVGKSDADQYNGVSGWGA